MNGVVFDMLRDMVESIMAWKVGRLYWRNPALMVCIFLPKRMTMMNYWG